MNKEQYNLYLQTPHWRSFRERVLLRSVVSGKYKCESCGDLFRRAEMKIHHKHYKTVGRELPTDVAVSLYCVVSAILERMEKIGTRTHAKFRSVAISKKIPYTRN